MIFEAVIPESLAEIAKDHLLASLRVEILQEDLCFALWRPSTGLRRMTGLITEILLPKEGERKRHGNVSFEAQYLVRATRRAFETNSGVAFMHSHPAEGWQDMSSTDVIAERDRIAPPVRATGLPLLGLTTGTDGVWSARFWEWNGRKYERKYCEKVRITGSSIQLCLNPRSTEPVKRSTRLRRTIDTWGLDHQTTIANLRIGIVGVGSVGTVVAETLARVGVTSILLIDADRVKEHNLDRMFYATSEDIGRFKVDLVAQHLRKSATASSFRVDTMRSWIQERDAFAAALDCDVLFVAVDRPLPKDVLNNIAYIHHIPVVFGGIRVAKKLDGDLADATWSVVRASPDSRCLRCDGQYTTSDVMMELDGSFDDPSYIAGHTAKNGNENVFPFSLNLGSLMVLEMLRMVLRETWWPESSSKFHFSYVSHRLETNIAKCHEGCSIKERIGDGDNWSYPFLDEPVARVDHPRKVRHRVVSFMQSGLRSFSRFLKDR